VKDACIFLFIVLYLLASDFKIAVLFFFKNGVIAGKKNSEQLHIKLKSLFE
jgi:hypothetical protein